MVSWQGVSLVSLIVIIITFNICILMYNTYKYHAAHFSDPCHQGKESVVLVLNSVPICDNIPVSLELLILRSLAGKNRPSSFRLFNCVAADWHNQWHFSSHSCALWPPSLCHNKRARLSKSQVSSILQTSFVGICQSISVSVLFRWYFIFQTLAFLQFLLRCMSHWYF